MSRYRGPCFKRIRRLGTLPGLSSKSPKDRKDRRNQSESRKKSQYRIRLEEKQKLRFHYGLTERQLQKNAQFSFWRFDSDIKFLLRQFKSRRRLFTNESIVKIIPSGIAYSIKASDF